MKNSKLFLRAWEWFLQDLLRVTTALENGNLTNGWGVPLKFLSSLPGGSWNIKCSLIITIGCYIISVSSVQFSRSVMSDSLWPHVSQHARPPCPSPAPEFTQTHVHRVGDAIQPSHPLSSLLLLPPIPPSIRVFSNESALRMRWPKYWSFSFSIIPSKEIPGLISFRMDWLGLRAVQGTLKSLLQHHSSKASILQHSAFFTVQLSHLYTTTGKTIALTR